MKLLDKPDSPHLETEEIMAGRLPPATLEDRIAPVEEEKTLVDGQSRLVGLLVGGLFAGLLAVWGAATTLTLSGAI